MKEAKQEKVKLCKEPAVVGVEVEDSWASTPAAVFNTKKKDPNRQEMEALQEKLEQVRERAAHYKQEARLEGIRADRAEQECKQRESLMCVRFGGITFLGSVVGQEKYWNLLCKVTKLTFI